MRNQINITNMKGKGLFALVVTIVAIVLASSFIAKGYTMDIVDGYEMRPVICFQLPEMEDYIVLDCCLEVPNKSCEWLIQSMGCTLL